MGDGRRRLTRADLEAMVGEFDIVERYGGASPTVDEDLHRIRRNVRRGVRVEDWARARLAAGGALHNFCKLLYFAQRPTRPSPPIFRWSPRVVIPIHTKRLRAQRRRRIAARDSGLSIRRPNRLLASMQSCARRPSS